MWEKPEEYYDDKLPMLIEQSVRNIFEVRKIAFEMEKIQAGKSNG